MPLGRLHIESHKTVLLEGPTQGPGDTAADRDALKAGPRHGGSGTGPLGSRPPTWLCDLGELGGPWCLLTSLGPFCGGAWDEGKGCPGL